MTTNKRYSIWLKIKERQEDSYLKKDLPTYIDRAKKEFINAIKDKTKSRDIIIKDSEKQDAVVDIELKRDNIEELLDLLRAIDVVDVIDPEFDGPVKESVTPIQEEPKKKDLSRFLK